MRHLAVAMNAPEICRRPSALDCMRLRASFQSYRPLRILHRHAQLPRDGDFTNDARGLLPAFHLHHQHLGCVRDHLACLPIPKLPPAWQIAPYSDWVRHGNGTEDNLTRSEEHTSC